jgi:hypothetical protein
LTIHDYTSDAQILAGHFRNREHILRMHPGGRSLFAKGFQDQGQPVLASEYGGVKFVFGKSKSDAWGYCEAVSGEQFEEKYRDLTSALLSSPDVQGYCYTQLTDVGTEENGLLTIDRKPKIPVERICAINKGRS